MVDQLQNIRKRKLFADEQLEKIEASGVESARGRSEERDIHVVDVRLESEDKVELEAEIVTIEESVLMKV